MPAARFRLIAALGLVPPLLTAVLSVWRPAALEAIERATYDAVIRRVTPRPPGGRVVIVDVDERSLTELGQWPWRRDRIGALVTRLRDAGAAMVALDIIFAEPDRYEGSDVQPDAALAAAVRSGGVVLGYGMMFGEDDSAGSCIQHPIGLAVVGGSDLHPWFNARGAICSLPDIAAAAGASGFLNAAPDSDGLLRRAPILIGLDGRVYPALGLAAVAAMDRTPEATLQVANARGATLTLSRGNPATTGSDANAIPLDGTANLLLRYRGPKRTFTYVSAADVMGGTAPTGAFRDKLVLVGTTALGTREVVSTPLDTQFTGVEVQATIADNLLQRDYIHRPHTGLAAETIVALLLTAGVSLSARRLGPAKGAVASMMATAAVWGGSVSLLSAHGAYLAPLYPTLGASVALTFSLVAGFLTERGRAERAGRESQASRRLMIQTLLSLTEIKDVETGRHSRRTQAYTRVLAQALARHPDYRAYLTADRIDLLATLAPLHDIGKVGVPDRVLNKPGALTEEEMAEMRRHPAHGRDVIVKAQQEAGVHDDMTLAIAKDIVYTHHERWDGRGYPEGLHGRDIPIPGRVMALVDVYDAISTRRLYAEPITHHEAVAFIVKGRGTHFDPAVVDAFLQVAPVLASLGAGLEEATPGADSGPSGATGPPLL
jgi:adenylate cyclase